MGSQVGRDSDKFMLRLPDGMREAIKAAADANSRSMNAEINARLLESLKQGPEDGKIRIHLFVASAQEKLDSADVLEAYAKLLREEAARLMGETNDDLYSGAMAKLKR